MNRKPSIRLARAASIVLAGLALALSAAPASAQLTAGANNNVISYGGFLIGNDIAYDPVNGVYLGVIGYGDLWGAFVDKSGARIGNYFRIGATNMSSPYAHYPRCVYVPELNNGQGGFLVAWSQWESGPSYVYSSVVTYPAGVLTAPQRISDGGQGGARPPGTGLAYSSTSHTVLVAWGTYAAGVQGRLVNAATGVISGAINQLVDAGGAQHPALAWNSATDEFGLVYAGYNPVAAWVGFERIGSNGVAVAAPATFDFNNVTFLPGVSVNSTTHHYVLAWARGGGARSAEFDQSGTMVGSIQALGSRIGTPDGVSLAYNSASGTYLTVSEDNYSYEVAGIELDGSGMPKGTAIGLSSGATSGSFVPRVTARPDANEWAISYSRNQNALADQMVTTASTTGPAPLALAVSANRTAPFIEGTAVTWTATSTGGTAPIEYEFWEYTAAGGWTVGQAYSTANTFTWTPPVGTDSIQVWARSSGSTAAYDAYAATGTFAVNPPRATISSFTSNVTFPSAPNVTATWTAVASVPGGTVEYKFWSYTAGTGWTMVQDWGGINTFTWILSDGTHAVQVWARRVGSTANFEDWRSTGLFTVASSPARMTALTVNVPNFPASPGAAMTWTATATGGSAALEYKFWLYDWSSATWSVLRDWAPSNQATWTPTAAGTGWHAMQTWVRSVGFTGTYEDWKGTGYFNITDSTDLTLTPNRSLTGLSESAGNSVTWTAQMMPTSGAWEYEVWSWSIDPGTGSGVWILQRPYATETTFTWFPAAGTHAVQVWGRQVGSSARYERWVSTGWFVVNR